jgi:hypothetical protein
MALSAASPPPNGDSGRLHLAFPGLPALDGEPDVGDPAPDRGDAHAETTAADHPHVPPADDEPGTS